MGLLDYSRSNPWVSDALATISQGLLSYGSGNQNTLAQLPQFLAERQRYRKDDQRQAKMDQRQEQIWQMQEEERLRTQNQEAAKQQAFQGLLPTLPENIRGTAQAMGPSFVDIWGKEQIQNQFEKPQGPNSSIAKAAADLKAGLIDQPTYDAFVRKETYIAPQQPREPRAPNWTTLVGPDGKEVTVDGNSPQAAQLVQQGYIERRSSLFPSLPAGYQPDPNNPAGLAPIPNGPADPKNPLNVSDTERAAAGFADRLVAADQVIEANTAAGTSYIDSAISSIPFIGNTASSEARQQYDQAKRDFINAQLRKESGATIQPSEFESAEKQYFPQPGDGPDVIKQKAEARKIAIQNMLRNGGGAATQKPADNDPLGIRS